MNSLVQAFLRHLMWGDRDDEFQGPRQRHREVFARLRELQRASGARRHHGDQVRLVRLTDELASLCIQKGVLTRAELAARVRAIDESLGVSPPPPQGQGKAHDPRLRIRPVIRRRPR